MNPEAIIALVVALIAIAMSFKLRRITAAFTPRQNQSNTIWIQTIMIGFMIWIYFDWLAKRGTVGIWTWIGGTIYLIGNLVFLWRRFTQNRIPEDPTISDPDQTLDTTSP